jgi:glutamate-ammonia-ligase adenylyltransferase
MPVVDVKRVHIAAYRARPGRLQGVMLNKFTSRPAARLPSQPRPVDAPHALPHPAAMATTETAPTRDPARAKPLAARLTRLPIPHDPAAGAEAAAQAGLAGPLADLVAGAAGGSPYLKGLIAREAAWLAEAVADPEGAVDAVLAPLSAVPLADLGPALRQAKRRVALITALADLGGAWPLETVTGMLTRLADAATDAALRALVAEAIRRGRLPGQGEADAADGAGMIVLAMGKMGAFELNYSSDIDLICLFDETRYPGAEQEARAEFIRITRKLCALLSDITAEGYVFRTDLRLRPDAAVTPVCLSTAAAYAYYESVGRTWERAAYIKARPCAGDIAAGRRFLRALAPFVWRRHLDFAAIQDAHDMRLRIRDAKGLGGPLSLDGHDLKLGRGGIREIEFFAQTRQLIAGGRDPGLRAPDTVGALAALAAAGWVPADVAADLTAAYRAHREVEHRLQMVQDAQTQTLPATPSGWDRIARLCGAADTAAFRAALKARCMAVHALAEGFFAPGRAEEEPDLPPGMAERVEGWRAYPALRSARAVEIFRRVRPRLLAGILTRAADPAEALAAFDGFLAGLPAGVQILSLFEANPPLVDLIVDICATAPALARHLARNPGVFDAVIGGAFFAPWPGRAALAAELAARLEAIPDYERKLDQARVWQREWHFRIGVHHLRGIVDAFEAGKQYADLAEAVLAALWPVVVAEFALKHGAPPGRGAMVLGMGSLGAGRLNAGSDLDLIVICDPAGVEASAGPRPLAARAYYARLTQALVTAITAPTAEGRLYAVDMRLRPSGRQGPVATTLAAFRAYQESEAWTWEHLALTRARPVAGDASLAAEVEAFRRRLLSAQAGAARILPDTAAMRARLLAARPGGAWEAKAGPGRIMDIELFAQAAALRAGDPARRLEAQLRAGLRSGFIDAGEEAALLAAYRLLWPLQAGGRLLGEARLDPDAMGQGARAFLLRETGAADAAALAARLTALTGEAAAVIAARLGDGGNGDGGNGDGGNGDGGNGDGGNGDGEAGDAA